MKAWGLIGDDTAPAPLRPDSTAWSKLSPPQRQVESRKMEIYAAMVDRMDPNVGRLITYLRATGRYDNTIFIFSSDNGPAGEVPQPFPLTRGEPDLTPRPQTTIR